MRTNVASFQTTKLTRTSGTFFLPLVFGMNRDDTGRLAEPDSSDLFFHRGGGERPRTRPLSVVLALQRAPLAPQPAVDENHPSDPDEHIKKWIHPVSYRLLPSWS